jgi:acetyl esterase
MALDPQAQAVLDMMRQSGAPPYETLPAAAARQLFLGARAFLTPDPPEVAESRSLVASGPHGPIPMRFYRPFGAATAEVLPALVYYHGGGWVIGDLDTHDVVCRQLANRAGCAVVAVDYRLAPEHKFPVAVDDAFAALLWVQSEAAALRIDPARLAVGGDSAGGNLSAVVTLRARDAGFTGLRYQLLIYPATDFAGHYESQERFAEGPILTRANQAWFRGHYLRGEADYTDWRASPLRAPSLAGLPPAYVLTAGYDPLCDEGEAYAQKLEAAGVPVTRRLFPGQIHGFITMGRAIHAAETATSEAGDALKAAFAA